MKLVIATRNPGKVNEIGALLSDDKIELLSLADYPDMAEIAEDGDTFLENALIKARVTAGHTGLPALADDSGLTVDALDGEPGVRSARFAPSTEKRNRKLLRLLKGIPDDARTARFVCALALARPDGFEWTTIGICEGRITRTPAGNEGFGYDPIFFYPPLSKTFAELSPREKNVISHRGRALQVFKTAVERERILG